MAKPENKFIMLTRKDVITLYNSLLTADTCEILALKCKHIETDDSNTLLEMTEAMRDFLKPFTPENYRHTISLKRGE